MAQHSIVRQQNRTKEGNLVVPLDEVRTLDYGTLTYLSGYPATSGIIYAVASGKTAYLREIWVTELSGNAGSFVITDGAGNAITPHIKVAGGQERKIETMIGPVTSGFIVASGSPICADITVTVQVNPNVKE